MSELCIFAETVWKHEKGTTHPKLVPTGKYRLTTRTWDGYDKPDFEFVQLLTFSQAKQMVSAGIASDHTVMNNLTESKRPRYRIKANSKKIS